MVGTDSIPDTRRFRALFSREGHVESVPSDGRGKYDLRVLVQDRAKRVREG